MKNLFNTLLVTLFALSITSCQNDDNGSDSIWDVYPLNFYIYVSDASGNNLLSEDYTGNILDQDIKIIFDRMEFPLGVDMNDVYTRYYMPYMYGLQLSSERLVFGEFDGAMDHKDTFVISWGDGTYDDVSFEYDFEWGAGDGAPSSSKTIYLNDVKLDDTSAIRIVK